MVGTQEGEVVVHSYDWTGFLAPHFKKIEHIKKQHHFEIKQADPGVLYVRQFSDTEENKQVIMKDNSWETFPDEIIPNGLSLQRP